MPVLPVLLKARKRLRDNESGGVFPPDHSDLSVGCQL